VYSIVNLPFNVRNDLKLGLYDTIIISHVVLDPNTATLMVLPRAIVKQFEESMKTATTAMQLEQQHDHQEQDQQHRQLAAPAFHSTGINRVLVVRVSYLQYEPNVTTSQLKAKVFGLGPDAATNNHTSTTRINLRRQIKACSFRKLRLWPAKRIPPAKRSRDSSEIVHGVTEMHITKPLPQQQQQQQQISSGSSNTHDNSVRVLESAVMQVLQNWYGTEYVSNLQHILLVFPNAPGVIVFHGRNYIAYAVLRGQLSVYNNHWSLSLSALAHELGHNWNLNHAGEGTLLYDDTTGYLGWGDGRQDYPQSCYNAQKNWALGWYNDRSLALEIAPSNHQALDAATTTLATTTSFINTTTNYSNTTNTTMLPWTGKLATFVDYDATTVDEPVLLQIQSDSQPNLRFYIQYNRAKQFNRHTREHRNKVVIIREDGPIESLSGHQSFLVGAITLPRIRTKPQAETHLWQSTGFASQNRSLFVHICSRVRSPPVDYVGISVYLEGQMSGCLL